MAERFTVITVDCESDRGHGVEADDIQHAIALFNNAQIEMLKAGYYQDQLTASFVGKDGNRVDVAICYREEADAPTTGIGGL